ncbi:MAG TPA: DNA-processing protein DprA [Candidatus Baltobacteraceae bacterium]|nr:DNA-processing protein DprA [Candidatus Baltobacteraceae bacterium]
MEVNVRGRLPKGGIAIVGSRRPPPQAVAFAFALAYGAREPVIAGLAPGIDVAAHRGALAAGVPTVAFVGYGFGATDPPELMELEDAIVRAGGAVATLLAPGTPASERSRIERDRLQAEQARAVVLVCSEAGGGALFTMQFAKELGRLRFAVVPPDDSAGEPFWAGNLASLADGAERLPFDAEAALAILHYRMPPLDYRKR